MDAEGVGLEDYRDCLRDLETVNTLTLGRRPTIRWLERATCSHRRGDRFSLLDVGFGHGDMLRAISAWARRRGLEPCLYGIDLNPRSAATAAAETPSGSGITFLTGDVFDFSPPEPMDFVISALFTHHLTDAEAAAFLTWMEERTLRGWFVNDLHRLAVAFYGFTAISHFMGWHRYIRNDGPVSIARGFRPDDWREIASSAGLDLEAVSIERHFPFRLCIGRIR
jgi:hypothetical protein